MTTAIKPTQYREAPIRRVPNMQVLYVSKDIYFWRFIDPRSKDLDLMDSMWNNVSREIISRCMQGL